MIYFFSHSPFYYSIKFIIYNFVAVSKCPKIEIFIKSKSNKKFIYIIETDTYAITTKKPQSIHMNGVDLQYKAAVSFFFSSSL